MPILPAYLGYLGTIVMGALYLWRFFTEGKDNLSQETQARYENAIKSFELQQERQNQERADLAAARERERADFTRQIDGLKAMIQEQSDKIATLEGLVTGRPDIKELKTILTQFLPILPMMPQFTKNDEVTHNLLNQLLSGQRVSQGLIHDDFKATNRVERRMLETPPGETDAGGQANVPVKKRRNA